MGNVVLERVSSIKYLGVTLDERFSCPEHIISLRKKISSSAGILSKLRYYVDTQTLIKVYYALIHSYLQYALICWGSASKTALRPLNVIQNRTLCHICWVPLIYWLDAVYLNMRLLKLEDMYEFEIAKFVHAYHKHLLPIFFLWLL